MKKVLFSPVKDFHRWYEDIILKSELAVKGFAKGTILFLPKATLFWDKIKVLLNKEFTKLGAQNVLLPTFINRSFLQGNEKHAQLFEKESFKVKIDDNYFFLRPTSEVVFSYLFSKKLVSHRQLPLIYNQWCNVFRKEENTKFFLRNNEFYWQEGHSIHKTEKEAIMFIKKIIFFYSNFFNKQLSIAHIIGKKSALEKFSGAKFTYTIETLLRDGQSLQLATAHYFSDSFSKKYKVVYQNEKKNTAFPFQVSWGLSTRVIGALIMAHSNERGLVLPKQFLTFKVVIFVFLKKSFSVIKRIEKILKFCRIKFLTLFVKQANYSDIIFKYKDIFWENFVRIEIGEKELKFNYLTLFSNNDKIIKKIAFNNFINFIKGYFQNLNKNIFLKHAFFLKQKIFKDEKINSLQIYKKILSLRERGGFFYLPFCNVVVCEKEIKKQTFTVSRCLSKIIIKKKNNCFACWRKATYFAYFAKSY